MMNRRVGVPALGLLLALSALAMAQVDVSRSGIEWQREQVSVEQLLAWSRWGNGYVGSVGSQSVQMAEHAHSEGMMLVSPRAYGQRVILSYEVMTLRPATVLVAILSASDASARGNHALDLPPGYDGSMTAWADERSYYFFAFHNAPHSRHPFVARDTPSGRHALAEADRSYMQPGRWHHVDVGRANDRLWLKIDGQTVLDTLDPEPLAGGHLVFRIRGTGMERASCLIKNVALDTPAVTE